MDAKKLWKALSSVQKCYAILGNSFCFAFAIHKLFKLSLFYAYRAVCYNDIKSARKIMFFVENLLDLVLVKIPLGIFVNVS